MGQSFEEWLRKNKPSNKIFDKLQAEEHGSFSSIIFVSILCIVLIGSVFYFSTKHLPADPDVGLDIPRGKFSLYEPIFAFQKKNHAWPTTKEELQTFIDQNKLDVTIRPYSSLVFQPEKDGSLRVEYQLKQLGGPENGSFSLSKPGAP